MLDEHCRDLLSANYNIAEIIHDLLRIRETDIRKVHIISIFRNCDLFPLKLEIVLDTIREF